MKEHTHTHTVGADDGALFVRRTNAHPHVLCFYMHERPLCGGFVMHMASCIAELSVNRYYRGDCSPRRARRRLVGWIMYDAAPTFLIIR